MIIEETLKQAAALWQEATSQTNPKSPLYYQAADLYLSIIRYHGCLPQKDCHDSLIRTIIHLLHKASHIQVTLTRRLLYLQAAENIFKQLSHIENKDWKSFAVIQSAMAKKCKYKPHEYHQKAIDTMLKVSEEDRDHLFWKKLAIYYFRAGAKYYPRQEVITCIERIQPESARDNKTWYYLARSYHELKVNNDTKPQWHAVHCLEKIPPALRTLKQWETLAIYLQILVLDGEVAALEKLHFCTSSLCHQFINSPIDSVKAYNTLACVYGAFSRLGLNDALYKKIYEFAKSIFYWNANQANSHDSAYNLILLYDEIMHSASTMANPLVNQFYTLLKVIAVAKDHDHFPDTHLKQWLLNEGAVQFNEIVTKIKMICEPMSLLDTASHHSNVQIAILQKIGFFAQQIDTLKAEIGVLRQDNVILKNKLSEFMVKR